MSDFDDALERYEQALEAEHALRQQRQEAIAADNLDKVREISKQLIVAQELRLQLQAAVAELEAAETASGEEQLDRAATWVGRLPTPFRTLRIPAIRLELAALLAGLLLLALAWSLIQHGTSQLPVTSTPVLTLTATSLSSAAITATPSGSTIRVAVPTLDPPLSYIDQAGKGIGLSYDVIEEICKRLGCNPSFLTSTSNGEDWLILSVENNDADLAAVRIPAQGSASVDYSTPYFQVYQVIFVRSNEQRFSNAGELSGGNFIVGAEVGTDSATTAKTLVSQNRLRSYDSLMAVENALIAGDIDAAIADSFTGLPEASASQLKTLNDRLDTQEFGFAFQRGSSLVGQVNTAISNMQSDKTLGQILDKWARYFG